VHLTFLRRAVPTLALLAALAPAAARAQGPRGFFVGGGLGAETIGQAGTRAQVSGEVGMRAGYRFSPGVALMLESAVHGMDAHVRGETSASAFVPGDVAGASTRRPLTTSSLLVALQLGVANGWYARPAVGLGSHSYTYYEPHGGDVYLQRTGHEGGPAAQLAVGHPLNRPGTVGIEALGLYSHGEDSTSPRWAAGVQLTYELRF
jgi:hypothetical protein